MTRLLALLSASVLTLAACQPAPHSHTDDPVAMAANTAVTLGTERRQKISENWLYLENPERDVALVSEMDAWDAVDLPHTWNALDTTDDVTGYRRDGSWYRKQIDLDIEAGERYFLHFEAAQFKADVYVNGERSGGHVGGYVGWDMEVTDQLRSGANDILVRVSNAVDKNLVPSQKADFFKYGGLTRDVWIEQRPDVFLDQVRVNTDVNAERAVITLTPFMNGGEGASYRTTITAPDGSTVFEGDAMEVTLNEPQLWSPDTPHIYRLSTTAFDADGQPLDTYEDTFGLRWFEFLPNGPFMLNGERLLLRGTHLHEGFAGVGSAMSDAQRIADMEAIKELGANFLRLGHYSHDPVVYEAADRLGIILYDEVPWNRGGVGGQEWRDNTQHLTRSMIAQNYNRASVFFWSLGNEMYWLPDVEGGGDKARVAEELQLLQDIAKEMDPGRLTTIRKFPEGADIVDSYSPSIWAGWYGGGYVQYQDAIEAARAEHPALLHMEYGGSSHVGRYLDKPFGRFGTSDPDALGSVEEAVNQTGVTSVAKSKVWDMSYMIDLFDWYLRLSETDPNFAGNAQWAFKDFGTPIRPENPLPFVNMKGLVQRDGIKKDVYHVFASYWQTDPTCWIESPDFNYRTGDATKTISVFCNTESAELSHNGAPLGRKNRDINLYPASGLTWDVTLDAGENTLSVDGFDETDAVVAEHGYTLTYQPRQHGNMVDIILTTDNNADGSVTVLAEAVDRNGLRVVDMNDRAYFTIDGGGTFLQHQGTPMGSRTREFANGTASIILYPGETGSDVNIQTQDYRGYYIKVPAR